MAAISPSPPNPHTKFFSVNRLLCSIQQCSGSVHKCILKLKQFNNNLKPQSSFGLLAYDTSRMAASCCYQMRASPDAFTGRSNLVCSVSAIQHLAKLVLLGLQYEWSLNPWNIGLNLKAPPPTARLRNLASSLRSVESTFSAAERPLNVSGFSSF